MTGMIQYALCGKFIRYTFPHHYATILYCWHQAGWGHGLMLFTPNPDSAISMKQSDLAMFFHASVVQCWWSRAHWSLLICCNSPFVTRTDKLCVPRCRSAHHCCTALLFACLCPAWELASLAILLWPLSSIIFFSPTGIQLTLSIMPCSKSLRSLVLLILTFNRTVTECLDACLPTSYNHSHVTHCLYE